VFRGLVRPDGVPGEGPIVVRGFLGPVGGMGDAEAIPLRDIDRPPRRVEQVGRGRRGRLWAWRLVAGLGSGDGTTAAGPQPMPTTTTTAAAKAFLSALCMFFSPPTSGDGAIWDGGERIHDPFGGAPGCPALLPGMSPVRPQSFHRSPEHAQVGVVTEVARRWASDRGSLKMERLGCGPTHDG
jgi:hypothetical protein